MPSDRTHPFDLPIQRILVDLETRLPPWMKLVNASPSDTAYARLSNEIIALTDLISPTSKEQQVRKDIVGRLQLQARNIWPSAAVVPVGSYAQNMYTSSSDMDLFILVPNLPESPENLEILYHSIESSTLASAGTLNIVRGARVPIIKYIDSRGSGIQVDISMNNGSATASTSFIQHRLSLFPILRPLTMVLKQWLFQRKMNEVYSRGGLSSYALFLLVLAVVIQHRLESLYPSNELVGRYLVQFLREWSEPTAFAAVIRPLTTSIDKSILNWGEPFQPFSLYPVNEENCIGGQSFSIREIQQEWKLSLNALGAAIEEYTKDIKEGRQTSLLGSIVGLTTREYECRKQINSISMSDTIAPPNIIPIPIVASLLKQVSPPPEFNPVPPKRIKFRNMLTRDGGVLGDEEIQKMAEEMKQRKKGLAALLDLSEANSLESPAFFPPCQTTVPFISPEISAELNELSIAPSIDAASASQSAQLLDFDSFNLINSSTSQSLEPGLSPPAILELSQPISPLEPVPAPLMPCSGERVDLSMRVATQPLSSTLLFASPAPPLTAPRPCTPSLLNLEDNIQGNIQEENNTIITSSLTDLVPLALPFESTSVSDLSGIDFTELTRPTTSTTEATLIEDVPPHEVVFQGRNSRKSHPETNSKKEKVVIDPTIAERAFGKFSLGIRA